MSWLPNSVVSWSRRFEFWPGADEALGAAGTTYDGDLRWWTAPRRFAIPTRFLTGVFLLPWAISVAASHWTSPGPVPFDEHVRVVCTVVVAARWLVFGGWVTVDPTERMVRWQRPGRAGRITQAWSFDEVTAARVRHGAVVDTVWLRIGWRRIPFRVSRGTGPALASALRDGVGSQASVVPGAAPSDAAI